LFESVVGGERIGRYSFVGSNPFLTLTATGSNVVIEETGGEKREFTSEDPLKDLDAQVAQYRSASLPALPRFCGGAVGFAGYDVIRYTENLPNVPTDDRHLPDLTFAFYSSMVVFDHIRKVVLVVALADTQNGDLKQARTDAEERLDVLCRQLSDGGGGRRNCRTTA
jgi:anthranilate synthase component 1